MPDMTVRRFAKWWLLTWMRDVARMLKELQQTQLTRMKDSAAA